jgi:hypothetical protein
MTQILPSNVLAFAAGDPSLFIEFKDYWNQYRSENGPKGKHYAFSTKDQNGNPISFMEKENLLNAHLKREIGKRAGVDFSAQPVETLVSHPMVKYWTFAIVDQLIDAVLPDTIIDSIGPYAELRQSGMGDSFRFQVRPRDLFAVSKAGRLGMKTAEIKKQFEGEVTVVPEMRQMAVGVSLYRVLTGQESLAIFVAKAIKSFETAANKEVYDTFQAAMVALSTSPAASALQISGYSQASLTKMGQRVSAWSGGAAPMVLGTKVALASILPDDANYRYELESEFVQIGYMRHAFGMDIFELPQVADWSTPFATVLSDSYIYVVAPGTDKIVKLCLEGSTMSNTDDVFAHANLVQTTNIWKSWKAAVVTSSIAGILSL